MLKKESILKYSNKSIPNIIKKSINNSISHKHTYYPDKISMIPSSKDNTETESPISKIIMIKKMSASLKNLKVPALLNIHNYQN